METARLIGHGEPTVISDISEGGLIVAPNENHRRAEALRALVARAREPGSNTIIVTHKPNLTDAFGKDWFDVREGEASVFKPDGHGKAAFLGRLDIAQWSELLK